MINGRLNTGITDDVTRIPAWDDDVLLAVPLETVHVVVERLPLFQGRPRRPLVWFDIPADALEMST